MPWRLLAAALLLGLAGFLVVDEGKHEGAAVALAAVGLAVFVIVVNPAVLFSTVDEFSLGPFSAKLKDARAAAKQTAPEEPDTRVGEAPEPTLNTVLDLRLRLEAKLTYLAKHPLVGS